MSLIALDNAGKSYGKQRALGPVDLIIEDNATTAVVGPSGSGKSTLLRLINGLERPTTGRVLVFDRPIDYDRLPELRRGIGYAVQGTGLFPHMTAWENITLLGRIAGISREAVHARANELMALVDLSETLSGRYPHELSGGQQQRVGLCRAMMLDPRIFLLDEPFGALDSITRGDIHREFLKLQRSAPRTIVLVTHDLREAFTLADRIVVLDDGGIVQEGSRRDLLDSPATPLVRRLIDDQLGDWSTPS